MSGQGQEFDYVPDESHDGAHVAAAAAIAAEAAEKWQRTGHVDRAQKQIVLDDDVSFSLPPTEPKRRPQQAAPRRRPPASAAGASPASVAARPPTQPAAKRKLTTREAWELQHKYGHLVQESSCWTEALGMIILAVITLIGLLPLIMTYVNMPSDIWEQMARDPYWSKWFVGVAPPA